MNEEIKQLLIDCANFIQPYDDGGNEAERLMERLDKALGQGQSLPIQNVMSFGYEYFMEVNGVMKKVADSRTLCLAQKNEEMFARRFREDVLNGKIKGYVKDCS